MSRKEVPRAGLVKAAVDGKISNQEGARALRLSVRQFKRLKARYRVGGAAGLLHRSRGRVSRRRLRPELRKQVVRLMTTVYAGFNDVHLTEKLQECHALPISRASVRRLRVALGRPARHRRRAPQHRSRRERAPAPGQLVQLDASPFAWFEDRAPQATLHGLIDDATSIPLALWFRPVRDAWRLHEATLRWAGPGSFGEVTQEAPTRYLDQLANVIAADVRVLLRSLVGMVFLLDRGSGALHSLGFDGPELTVVRRGQVLPPGSGSAWRAIEGRAPFVTRDLYRGSRRGPADHDADTATVLCLHNVVRAALG